MKRKYDCVCVLGEEKKKVLVFFSFFFSVPHGPWDISSPTTDQTRALGSEVKSNLRNF